MRQRIISVSYYTENDALLWEDPIVFRRLWGIGNELVHDYQLYTVVAVRVESKRQIVTVRPHADAE